MKDQHNALNTYFWNVGKTLPTSVCWQKVRWRCLRVMPNLFIGWA